MKICAAQSCFFFFSSLVWFGFGIQHRYKPIVVRPEDPIKPMGLIVGSFGHPVATSPWTLPAPSRISYSYIPPENRIVRSRERLKTRCMHAGHTPILPANSKCISPTHVHRINNNTLLFYLPSTSNNQTRPEQTMASPTSPINTSVALMLLLLFLVRVHVDCSPSPSNSSSSSDIGECSPQQLLPPLVPCLAFVQGMISSPSEPCCNSIVNLYLQHSKCLCVLLDDTTTLPINRTLMLQLPLLCSLNSSSSSCPGAHYNLVFLII